MSCHQWSKARWFGWALVGCASITLTAHDVRAQTTKVKADNTTTLDQGASWVGGVAPNKSTGLDSALWDSTVTAANTTVSMAGSSSDDDWTSLKVGSSVSGNPAGDITINSVGTRGLKLATSSTSGSLDMSDATVHLNLNLDHVTILGSSTTAVTVTHGDRVTFNNATGIQYGNATHLNFVSGAVTLANLKLSDGTSVRNGATIGGDSDVTISAMTSASISGATSSLVYDGTATLLIPNANANWGAFAGGPLVLTTTVSNGTLALGNNGALGTSLISLNGGTLRADGGPISIPNATSIGSGNTSNSFIGGMQNLTFTGTFTGSLTGSRTLTVNNAGTTTLAGAVVLEDPASSSNRTFTIAGSGLTVISGPITDGGTGSNTLRYNSTTGGTLTLSGNNAYVGTTTLSAGTINVNSATAFGTSKVAYNGVTIDNSTGMPLTLTSNNISTLGGNNIFTGTSDLNLGTGTMSLNGNTRTWTVNSHTLTVGSIINGTGSNGLTKSGNGTLELSAANSYTGTTRVLAGTLKVDAASGIATSPSLVLGGGTLNSTGVDQAMTGTKARLTASSHIDLAGGGTVTLADSSTLHWTDAISLTVDNYTPGSDHLFVGNSGATLTANQVNQIVFSGPAGTGGGNNFAQLLSTGEVVPNNVAPAGVVTFGDVNHDSSVNVADVGELMLALSDLDVYEPAHTYTPQEFVTVADMNYDDTVNNLDLQGLINYLANGHGTGGGSLSAVPEPASWVLLVCGCAGLGLAAARRHNSGAC